VRQRPWRRAITIAVVASLLLGLAALGLGIEALRKANNGNGNESEPATSIAAPTGGTTVSGIVDLDTRAIGPNVTAVDFLASGGSYHDAKIETGTNSTVGWAAEWQSTTVPNGTYDITAVSYNAAGRSSRSASVTVKVKNP
jgi:hypothetical protein